jgi:hypothetical protein
MIRLNRELIDKLALLVEQTGAFWCDACRVHGVAESTFYDWLKKGNDELARVEKIRQTGKRARIANDRAIHVELVRRLQSAVAKSCIKDLQIISKCANGVQSFEVTETIGADGVTTRRTVVKSAMPDWRAALARLERRHGKKWRGVEGDLDDAFSGGTVGNQRKKIADLTPEELQRALQGISSDDDGEIHEYMSLLSNKMPVLKVEEIPLDDGE